ncbi:membrane-bound metal-dependent hydrolase [Exiguobacterium sp. AT1b]|uniref:Membrane-bound metal-dependent hydrolase n=1 Tax=Exiguobacterium sp. (strain ATCC BAA-1283 / AT1b) TaxID=360911 RepID=C4L1V6_EXISA|nr:metal-dependent hydrolase [Exiguobacterium sp. AT1b]ACQ69130.1 membrane-bound metal-dependent hydrolase [Exiguobacterium sp. AT1b]
MDTITHTLFGLTLYGAADKRDLQQHEKRALFVTTLVGSQIPDSDVISRLWDTEGMYQMWHRGITHSIFLVPLFALLIYILVRLLFRVTDIRYFWWALLSVFIHNTSDLFNAWGTGYFEPISDVRITFGVIPIVDFVYWGIFLVAWLVARKQEVRYKTYRYAWAALVLYVAIQSAQGACLYQAYADEHDEVALSSSFIPTQFTVITKTEENVSLFQDSIYQEATLQYELTSAEKTSLEPLFEVNQEARTLTKWSPFVVIVANEERLGVFDPRFYDGESSFLYEYIER